MHCSWIVPKTFHYRTLKKPYENPPNCHKTCVFRARPSMEKIQAQITISEDLTKFMSETLTLPSFHPPSMLWLQLSLFGGSGCRTPFPLHRGPQMALYGAVSFWSHSLAAATSVQAWRLIPTRGARTHHHCWKFRSYSTTGKERKKRRNVRESDPPLFLWWLILCFNLIGHGA